MSRPGQRHPSPSPQFAAGRKQQSEGLNSQNFLSGVGVQAALGGLGYTVQGRQNGAGIPYLQPSLFASPKAPANGRINSEPPTPTSTGSGNGAGPNGSGRQTPTRAPSTGTPLGSPKVSGSYSLTTNTTTPGRRGSGNFSNTAPAGSLAGYTRNSGGGPPGSGPGLAGTGYGLGSAGQRATASTANGLGGGTAVIGLGSTMPAGSRPGTASRTGAGAAGGGSPAGGAGGAPRANTAAVPGLLFSVGSNQSMGSRAYQEDYRAISDTTSTPGMGHLHNVLLGAAVYDGHGGKQVSHWLCSSYCLLNRCMDAVQQLVAGGGSPNDVALVLEEVFIACGSTAIAGRMTAGSCVALALLVQAGGVPWVLSANVGDSRTVVVSWDDDAGGGGGAGRPEGTQMSIDHKLGPAKLSEETRRVQAAGGTVIQLFGTWRIDGSLAVARAIGDCDFSRYVSYKPTVSCRQVQRRDRWVIIGSDGLWDVMTNEEVASFCKAQHQLSAAKLSEALVREAVRNRGSGDNTTVVAVRLQYTPPAPAPA